MNNFVVLPKYSFRAYTVFRAIKINCIPGYKQNQMAHLIFIDQNLIIVLLFIFKFSALELIVKSPL